ncbi:Fur family transcriptional regulator [Campylobacter sp.]|uniref:Fur family transcriptional regulator n=1 Tax=Campylobacter sp. TaxID=205 RepID=UPI0026FA29EB|nr:Fur family transcriptional regulator [Campylobacter sp.]
MNYINLLKEHGLKATPQRISVLKILNRHMHPTIDELYEEICAENPSVSLATVYKNLNMLKDEGLVVEVNMPNQKARYDIFDHPHIHVVCEKCGKVSDIGYDEAALNEYKQKLEQKLGNFVEKMSVLVTVKGCKHCNKG